MLTLTASTGVIDAVGYLGLDKVFTGNMTGNVVILGMAATGADDLPVIGPLIALAGFMAGAAAAGRVLKRSPAAWTAQSTGLLSAVCLLLAGCIAALLVCPEPATWLRFTVTALLGGAMGTQAATARVIAVRDVTTVVITSTITGLAADSALGSGKGGGSARRVIAVLLMLGGAAVGAALLLWHVAAGLALSLVLTSAVTLLGSLHGRAP